MTPGTEDTEAFRSAMAGLEQLRRFAGPAAEFWKNYLEALRSLTDAAVVVIARRRGTEATDWGRVGCLPTAAPTDPALREFWIRVETLAQQAAAQGATMLDWTPSGFRRTDRALAVRLEADRAEEVWVAIILLSGSEAATAAEALRRLQLAAYVPSHFQLRRVAAHLQSGEGGAASVLDLVALLNRTRRFMEAAMALCNELSARQRCDRVSLGWERNGYVRIRAMSHTDKFERKMEAVQAMEAAMEESLDQGEAIIWPAPPGEEQITRDHEKFSTVQGSRYLCSVPLRLGDRPVGVLMFERQDEAFEEDEVRDLLIAADLSAPRMAELDRHDRWFGARWATEFREQVERLSGPRHTWSKVIAAAVTVLLAVLLLGRTTHRVEAPFTLRAEKVSYLTAPFNGFIGEVSAEPGASLKQGDRLLSLDTRDLLLEEAAALADRDRYEREAEKAQAENTLAEMRIAQAQAEQARVRLQMVRNRLSLSVLSAPHDGYVVEGDLKQRIGAPVRQGDVLFRVSDLATAYVEARVSERDVQEVRVGAKAEIAFASQPKLKFPVRVQLLEPVAVSDNAGNVFIVRCVLDTRQGDWWRPGMTGLAKIEGERQTFFWILFRRTVDYLRLQFWW
ncbi:MAG: efflux RND transporter periplasmic adaptor subunit [Opitutaceae bacterium]|nr:efflux RND transporter periplasmic adaptor subunit [Opitutaceae bacterium]